MPFYVQLTDLAGKIPNEFLVQALNDTDPNAVAADPVIWAQVQQDVQDAIDGQLGNRYEVPFTAPFPALITDCARTFALEELYDRRGLRGDQNPWLKHASDLRAQLKRIRNREEDLSLADRPANPPISTVTSCNKTVSKHNVNLV